MGSDFFTDKQKPEVFSRLSNSIIDALNSLKVLFPHQNIEALSWNNDYVAVPLLISVDLPTRGPVRGLDIRAQEPVFLLFHRKYYPHKAPSVWSNRKDFPSEHLPHLNPTRSDMASNFCLHRGSLDNWFAEHTIMDLIQRVQGWLRDAARDRLVRREDGFEPTRITGSSGYAVFDQSIVKKLVHNYWNTNNGNSGYHVLFYRLLSDPKKELQIESSSYAVSLEFTILREQYNKIVDLCKRLNELSDHVTALDLHLFGIIAWPNKKQCFSTHLNRLPSNMKELTEFAISYKMPLTDYIQTFISDNLQILNGIPVTIVIPRPQCIIGTNSKLEFMNFVINASTDNKEDDVIKSDARVITLMHRHPLTLSRAQDISSQTDSREIGKIMFIGCGAIGSKLIMHMARSGQCKMTLVDNAELSPHNLVRHALLSDSLGKNKAQALKSSIDSIFSSDDTKNVVAVEDSALDILIGKKRELMNGHNWIVDCSASSMIMNALCMTETPVSPRICRSEITDDGRIGLLSIEGPKRNPRIDDIQIILFSLSIENQSLSEWLKRNKAARTTEIGSTLEDINIGFSCSSETLKLHDDIVSMHSSSFANGFRNISQSSIIVNNGLVQIGLINVDSPVKYVVQDIPIPPLTFLTARNDPNWQIRMKYGLDSIMKKALMGSLPNETGGLLIGLINLNRKIVYITDVLLAPTDSKCSPYAFVRGTQDVPQTVLEIQERTGGMLGYVGEWHTHPGGGPDLSDKDMATVRKIKRNLDKIPLPTHIMIVTRKGVYPHIFDRS